MKTIYNYTQKAAAVMNASLKVEIFLSDAKENAGIAALCRGFMTKSDEKRSLLAWRAYSRCFLKKKTPTSSKRRRPQQKNILHAEKDLLVLPGIGESVKLPYTSPSHFQ